MSLSEVDRQLLQRCLDNQPQAWENFVDRFLGLVVHVANHTAATRQRTLDPTTRDDLVSEVFLTLIQDDFAVLRRFRRNCSLATYLTVIARRVIVRRLFQSPAVSPSDHEPASGDDWLKRLLDQEHVEQLLQRLEPREASAIRMFHMEGKSYREIGQAVGVAENSVGSLLHRAKSKLRNGHPGN